MKNLAIIPARGGSKRIPRKNIKDFLGKPIIAYSIETALQSGLFNEVMVSTDDEEIASIAIEFGASVPFLRSVEQSNDHATLADVIDEVKNRYLSLGRNFDYICCILPTAPFITTELLTKSFMSISANNNINSIRPVIRFSYPVQRAIKLDEGKISMFYPQHLNTRSQDLEQAYHDAGLFYWMRFNTGLRSDDKFGFEISELQAHDIDTEEDWGIAEIKYKFSKEKNENSCKM